MNRHKWAKQWKIGKSGRGNSAKVEKVVENRKHWEKDGKSKQVKVDQIAKMEKVVQIEQKWGELVGKDE